MKIVKCKICGKEITWSGNRKIDENSFECAKCEIKKLNKEHINIIKR